MKVIVIGSGFSGLSAATSLADKGHEVVILEKNTVAGGRARVFNPCRKITHALGLRLMQNRLYH